MDNNFIIMIIEMVILVAAFLIGKYVLKDDSAETIATVTAKTNLIIQYAEAFVAWAKQFLSKETGSQKMEAVIGNLQAIAIRYNLDITETEIRAIAQKAYDEMKASDIQLDLEQTKVTNINVPTQDFPKYAYNNGEMVEISTACGVTAELNQE